MHSLLTKMNSKVLIYKIFIPILCFILIGYCFIIFLPLPYGIHTGLDPSWQYAISYASSEKLTYGKDIIFTYGPLGYLIHGAVIDSNFWSILLFRCLIHLAFFGILINELIKLYSLKKWLNLFVLILSSLLFYILGAGIDYTILFIFLILLPYEIKFQNKYQIILYSLFTGVIAGFCLTTKFSLGICVLGAGIIYNGINLLVNIKHRKNLTKYSYQLVICSISTLWTTDIILNGLSKNGASLIDYLRNSLAISSGYSSAMSIVGSKYELAYALLQIILILLLLIKAAKNKENSLGYNLTIAFVLWITFKHGFVRQDGHVFIFVKFIPLLGYLSLRNQIHLNKKRLLEYLILIYIIFIPLVIPSFLPAIYLENFTAKIKYMLNINALSDNIIKSNQENLSEMKLPSQVGEFLKNKTVDVIPWEISLIPANNLNWQPRPIFQSYSAYTSSLDKINSQSILSNKPNHIIYNFTSIDGRHPFFDEPETFTNIFCNYEISSQFPNFINTKKLNDIMILQQRKSNICLQKENNRGQFSINWNKLHELKVDDRELIRAKIEIKYSMLGKIYKTLFRSPPVIINVVYTNGQGNSYRIIPENANNGVIISYLPQSSNDALALFKGELPMSVKSFSFSTVNPVLYKSQIEVNLISYNFANNSMQQKDNIINLPKLKNIKFLSEITDKYNGIMDSKSQEQKILKQGEAIFINGWSFEKNQVGAKKLPILITYSSNNYLLGITETGDSRPDVAKFFNQRSYYNSGWSTSLSSYNLPKGVHKIKAWIYERETNQAIPITGVYEIKID